MTPAEHDRFASELLTSLSVGHSETRGFHFEPDPAQSRNAASALAAILGERLFDGSGTRPTRTRKSQYRWRDGAFNCRTIVDRNYLWSNLRRGVADEIHAAAADGPAAYLLACSDPSEPFVNVWAIPEPVLYDSLPNLPAKADLEERTIQIKTDKQRFENFAASPDLVRYFGRFALSQQELEALIDSCGTNAPTVCLAHLTVHE